ncbi:MAG: FAD-dependent oxidoreductase, partial [Actinobacteria bacterium]|nr:FAD-dependent oxidoreductase [Actinomycetota bacterium]
EIGADRVVVAAGCWSGAVAGLPSPLRSVVRPVKGQLLRLRHPDGMPTVLGHTIRATVRGADIYLVPRADGEVVVGATQEERGPDRTVTAGAVHDLLRDAVTVLPVVSELLLAETCAGLRPGTPDNGPVVGWSGVDGLLMASGHYRNGILMSAVTADAVVACLTGQRPAAEWEPFTPGRFTGRPVDAGPADARATDARAAAAWPASAQPALTRREESP